MDLASFKLRYPSFTNDNEIQLALDDAAVLIQSYNIDYDKKELATAYLTAHLLSLLPSSGVSEPYVTMVKSGTNEVRFGDKVAHINDWLSSTSYGQLLILLIRPSYKGIGMVVI